MCLCIYVIVCSTEIFTLPCPLTPVKKMERSTVLSPWVTLHTFLPSGELQRKCPKADQNPKSLGGSGVDWKME